MSFKCDCPEYIHCRDEFMCATMTLMKTRDYAAVWRLIEYSVNDANFNMAADEAIALMVEAGSSPPTLRFYGWAVPSVTIGAFQRIWSINTAACEAMAIPVVRRPTGGRAIVHDDELTFSFSTGTASAPFSQSVLENYKAIAAAFFLAFKRLGLNCQMTQRRLRRSDIYHVSGAATANPMCFSAASYSEITIDGRKILGAAQKRYKGALLEQGSIPISINRTLISTVFTSVTDFPDDSLTGLREFDASLTPSRVAAALAEAFEEVFSVRLLKGQLSEAEASLTLELQKKYQLHDWNYRK
ncbi:MAG: hypothetical protein HQK97_00795 [Nitrospirae bacterium]|nr:hypothetical protein [Nitrospirota bacterium]